MLRRVLALSAVSLSLPPAIAWSQVASALEGRVTDATGAPVAGARVLVTENSTGATRATVTTGEGLFSEPQLTPGGYSIRVMAAGFSALVRDWDFGRDGKHGALDLGLVVGGDQQTVTVTADAPLLQQGTSDIQMTIPGAVVIGLPLNGRNFVNLAQLAPGVSLPPGTLLPRINGGRPRTNEYLFDGISALQPEPGQVAFFPIVDDIAEFTVEANNVPAEFGRFNGGVVNVTTRSGSNEVHLSLYDFFRNEDLNARNYFSRTEGHGRSIGGISMAGRWGRRCGGIMSSFSVGTRGRSCSRGLRGFLRFRRWRSGGESLRARTFMIRRRRAW